MPSHSHHDVYRVWPFFSSFFLVCRYLADTVCIGIINGNDYTNITTNAPAHTIQCMLLQYCIDSGYTIMEEFNSSGGAWNSIYKVRFGSIHSLNIAESSAPPARPPKGPSRQPWVYPAGGGTNHQQGTKKNTKKQPHYYLRLIPPHHQMGTGGLPMEAPPK